jgi:hypothetical protein
LKNGDVMLCHWAEAGGIGHVVRSEEGGEESFAFFFVSHPETSNGHHRLHHGNGR